MVKHQGNFGNWLRGRQDNQSHFYNRHTKELPELYKGQAIYVQDLERKTRSPAKVVDQGNTPRSYTVEAGTSVHLRRNRIHLRPNNSSNNPANNSSTRRCNLSSVSCNVIERRNRREYNSTTAFIEPVQVQAAHRKTARPLRLMGHLKRLHHISPLSRKQTFLISKQRKVQSL